MTADLIKFEPKMKVYNRWSITLNGVRLFCLPHHNEHFNYNSDIEDLKCSIIETLNTHGKQTVYLPLDETFSSSNPVSVEKLKEEANNLAVVIEVYKGNIHEIRRLALGWMALALKYQFPLIFLSGEQHVYDLIHHACDTLALFNVQEYVLMEDAFHEPMLVRGIDIDKAEKTLILAKQSMHYTLQRYFNRVIKAISRLPESAIRVKVFNDIEASHDNEMVSLIFEKEAGKRAVVYKHLETLSKLKQQMGNKRANKKYIQQQYLMTLKILRLILSYRYYSA